MVDDKKTPGENPQQQAPAAAKSQRQTRRDRIKNIRDTAAGAPKVTMAPRLAVPGRPRALDPDQVTLDKNVKTILGAGAMNCTLAEVAALHDVDPNTLDEFFVRYPDIRTRFDEARLSGAASVKRNQFKLSEKSPQMAIYLGEQILGQRDPYKMRDLKIREDRLAQGLRDLDMRQRELELREKLLEMRQPADLGSGLPIDIASLSLAQLMQLASRIRAALEHGTAGGLTIDAVREPVKTG